MFSKLFPKKPVEPVEPVEPEYDDDAVKQAELNAQLLRSEEVGNSLEYEDEYLANLLAQKDAENLLTQNEINSRQDAELKQSYETAVRENNFMKDKYKSKIESIGKETDEYIIFKGIINSLNSSKYASIPQEQKNESLLIQIRDSSKTWRVRYLLKAYLENLGFKPKCTSITIPVQFKDPEHVEQIKLSNWGSTSFFDIGGVTGCGFDIWTPQGVKIWVDVDPFLFTIEKLNPSESSLNDELQQKLKLLDNVPDGGQTATYQVGTPYFKPGQVTIGPNYTGRQIPDALFKLFPNFSLVDPKSTPSESPPSYQEQRVEAAAAAGGKRRTNRRRRKTNRRRRKTNRKKSRKTNRKKSRKTTRKTRK
jgi:hypothetical protein